MLKNISVADYMTKRMVKFTRDTNIRDAIKMMLEHKITSAPVVDEHGQLVGIFSEIDGLRVFLESVYDQGVSGKVGDYMATNAVSIKSDSSIIDAAEKFQKSTIRSFPVFEGSEFVGIISRIDILKALIAM